MKKNPLINAFAATGYIVLIACFMFYGHRFADTKDTVLAPIGMISLFTFSAAVMGFLFLSGPVQMYLDGDKKGAVNFFLKTLATFGITTLAVLSSFFLKIS